MSPPVRSAGPAAPAVESTTEAASFEAMFTRMLKPEGKFLEELIAAGFDPGSYRSKLPTRVWHACLDIARRHTFPELGREAGFYRLGQLYTQGFFQTIIGKVTSAAMPLLGLERSLARVPRAWKANQPTLQMEIQQEKPNQWLVEIRERGVLPDFCAGLLEGGAKPTGVKVKIDVVERGFERCLLRITGP